MDNETECTRLHSHGETHDITVIVTQVSLSLSLSLYDRLIRAGYDNKRDYFAKLAANVLRTANWAMNTVRETTE